MFKKIALPIIYTLSALFMLLTGFFSVASESGISINAFGMLAQGRYSAMFIVVGVFAVVVMAMGVVALVSIALDVYKGKGFILKLIPFIATCASFVYMILGIVSVEGMVSAVFVPFIIQFVLLAAQVFVDKVIFKEEKQEQVKNA